MALNETVETIKDFSKPLKIGSIYVISPNIFVKSGLLIPDASSEIPENFKLLGRIYYYSLALWQDMRSDYQIIKRNYDLSMNEPFTIIGVEKYNTYNVIQATGQEIKMGYIKFVGTMNEFKSTSMFSAFLIGESDEIT